MGPVLTATPPSIAKFKCPDCGGVVVVVHGSGAGDGRCDRAGECVPGWRGVLLSRPSYTI